MTSAPSRRTSTRQLLLPAVVTVVVFGFAGLALAALLGFEEPPMLLFLASAVLLLAAPVAVFAHLWLSDRLSREDKTVWTKALVGRRAPQGFALYLTSADRAAAAQTLKLR